MKKVLIILVVLVILAAGGYFAWNKFGSNKNTGKRKDPFVWGVTMRAHAINNYNLKEWRKQLEYAKELGVNYVRMEWQDDAWYDGKLNPVKMHDEAIAEIEKNGMNVYLIIGNNSKIVESKDPYYDGYNQAFQIASRYKGRIKYYQLANEISSESIKGAQFSGDKKEHFDEEEYKIVREWLKGASAGVKKADSEAYTVVVGQWIQYAFFEKIAEDNVDYDIIGWDWFSDMGLIKDNKMDDGTNIVEKLKQFEKPIMLVEVNQRPEGEKGNYKQNEAKQADYIRKMAEWSYNNDAIHGFFVQELMDAINYKEGGYPDRYGIVSAERNNSGRGVIGEPRKAFEVYKEIIAKYSK